MSPADDFTTRAAAQRVETAIKQLLAALEQETRRRVVDISILSATEPRSIDEATRLIVRTVRVEMSSTGVEVWRTGVSHG